jgi:hypothetical protein
MLKSMTRRAAALSILAVGVLAAGCESPQETAKTTIVIPNAKALNNAPAAIAVDIRLDTGTQKCVVTYKDDHAVVAPTQTVQWWVTNLCDDRTIKLVTLQFDSTDPTIHGKLKIDNLAFGEDKPMVARVKEKSQVSNGQAYAYHLYLDGVQQGDPDIIIEYDTTIIVPPIRTNKVR